MGPDDRTKPTPEALWEELVQEAGEDEVAAADAVSVEQAERELAEDGFDVPAERAKAEEFLEMLAGKKPAKPKG